MASPQGDTRVGTVFGPYELRSQIGVGGMGEVYRAYDTVKDRTVALKVLRPEMAADPAYQERFRRESRVAARLQEPHVIPVHDWGDVDGVLYIDMRLVEGTNLKQVLRQSGPLDPARAAWIISQVASALDAAHADGLVHRDIKPENVLLTPSDFAYLVDFGIARAGGDPGLTMTGAAIGSAAYMAPERFNGGQAGPSSDVYALACLLHECLTGRPPFPIADLGQLLRAHMLLPPPRPSDARPGLHRAFDDVIARGLAKQPGARFSSAGELARAATAAAAMKQAPTAMAPAPAAMAPAPAALPGTRPFSAVYPNSTATGYAPYPAPPGARPNTSVKRGVGRGQILLAGATVGLFAIAAVIAAFLILRNNDSPSAPVAAPPARSTPEITTQYSTPTTATTTTTTEPTTTESTTPTTTTTSPGGRLPGTDAQGFVGSYARCDAGASPAVVAETTKSQVVVCQAGSGTLYYRGLRLSDGATIQLANAVRTSDGFDVTNPADGTRYQVRPSQVSIISPGGQVDTEPMVEYAPT